MKWFRFLLFCLLLFSHSLLLGQEGIKWNDAVFGVTVRKPDKGKRWIVQEAMANTEASVLQSGDEILEINDKVVTVDDDLIALLNASGDTAKIKAKRVTTNPKTGRPSRAVTGEKTFKRTPYWEIVKARFTVQVDKLEGFEIWTHTAGAKALNGSTHFIPSVVMIDDDPKHVRMEFEFYSEDWLFVRKITFRHGQKEWVINKEFGEVKTEVLNGGIKEWFIDVDGWGEEALREVGNDTTAASVIRLHGKDYFKDYELTDNERAVFSDTFLLMELAKERRADLAKK